MTDRATEAEIEEAIEAMRATTITVHGGAKRSLVYYASIGIDCLKHDNGGTIDELLYAAADAALVAAAQARARKE